MARSTDDERRLIEGRLRELAGRKVPCDIDCYLAEAVMGHDFCETLCDGCLSTVLARLADLIEPSCDREALLALADEMYRDGKMQRERQKAGGHWFVDGLDVMEYARRIREACGVVA